MISAPARAPAFAALRQLAGIVFRPRVLAALAAFWMMLWGVLAAGYHLLTARVQPGWALPVATFDAAVWMVQAAAAFAGGWLMPVSRRPTARQVGAIVALATALLLARVAVQQLLAPILDLRQLTFLETTLFYYPRHMLVLTSCVAGGSALRLLVQGWERAAQVAALELSVARARLETLRNRVGPGFLLGSLDAIHRRMGEAPHAADALLVRTSELLRGRLRAAAMDQVPLHDELALAALYAQLAQECGRRPVRLRVDAPASLEGWTVPPCTVSWLVESSLLAAGDGAQPVELRVRVAEAEGELRMEVADDLRIPVPRRAAGREWHLVAALGDLLRHRYGDGEWVHAVDRDPAGVAVHVRIPSPAAGAEAAP